MKNKIKKYLNEFELEYKETKNKFYFIEKYKILVTGIFAFFGFVFGIFGFLYEGNHLFISITNTLSMFAFNFPDSYDKSNLFLLLSAICVAITIFFTALFTFFQEFINKYIAKKIIEGNHIAVFGLGEINRGFLNSDFKDDMAVIIEANANNTYISEYRQKGFGVILGDVLSSKQLELLNYETMQHAIIALGNDRLNIELAIKLIETIKEKKPSTPTRLIVHISNSELKEIFHQEFILPSNDNDIKIDIKTFSFHDECSKDLFDNHNLISNDLIKTNNQVKSVVLGNGNLAISILKDILLLSNFPNKNKHTIYLIEKDAKNFFEQVKLATYFEKEKFPSIEFKVIKDDYKKISFFKQEIFSDIELSNIFICYDEEETNLNLAIELNDKVYTRNNHLNTQVYFGMFNEYTLSHRISSNNNFFARFFTFGNMDEVFSKDKLIDEKNYNIAKLIHNGYGDEFKKDNLTSLDVLNNKWFNSAKFSDKLSNIAQGKHINIKLQTLGLKKVPSDKESKDLLKINQEIFDSVILPLFVESNVNYEQIHKASLELDKFWSQKDYEVLYMPREYNNLFEKLIECEHERWNTYHYLNGWDYSLTKDKSIKLHNCLKPLKEFKEKDLQITVLYDIYSILYIPNYLASAGWEIEKIEKDLN